MKKKNLYQNNLKNREFDHEIPQNLCVDRQDVSENKNFEARTTQSKTDSSRYFDITLAAGIIGLLLVTSSMHQAPSVVGGISPQNSSLPFEMPQKGVHVSTKLYTEKESKNYLNYDLIGIGYTPIEVTVQNHTANSYAISAASVPLACATSSDVAWNVTKKKIPGSVGLKIASFFFWPLMIPSTIEGVHTYKSHRSFAKDLEAKTLKEKDEIIPPYATVTRVLYIKKESFQEMFSVALQEVETKELLVVQTSVIS